MVDGSVEKPAQGGVLRAPRDDVVVAEFLTGPTRKRQIHSEHLVGWSPSIEEAPAAEPLQTVCPEAFVE